MRSGKVAGTGLIALLCAGALAPFVAVPLHAGDLDSAVTGLLSSLGGNVATDLLMGVAARLRAAGEPPESQAAQDAVAEAVRRALDEGGAAEGELRRLAAEIVQEAWAASAFLGGAACKGESGAAAVAVGLAEHFAAHVDDLRVVTARLRQELHEARAAAREQSESVRMVGVLVRQLLERLDAHARAHEATGAGPVSAVPCQLPTDSDAFTGHVLHLEKLSELAEHAAASHAAGSVAVCTVDGMPGVGKSALAVHAAYALRGLFPHGVLFVDLHGHSYDARPRDPGDVLTGFLRDLGVPPQRIPHDLHARAALYRDRLAGRRMLILLDNARDARQVRPLLPGGGGCLVLVTSRSRLKALGAALTISLGELPVPDAVALFRRTADLDPHGEGACTRVLEEIAQLCGRLPLALCVAAALLRHHPAWSPYHLRDQLREERGRLAVLADADPERDLRTVFSLSYRALGGPHRRLFRRLGLCPGAEVDAFAAAALLGADPPEATQPLLRELVERNLLAEPAQGRYRMHDLLREYAHQLGSSDPAEQRESALARLLDYYQHTAVSADAVIDVHRRPRPRAAAPLYAPQLTHPDLALAWLRLERLNLEACLAHAAARRMSERVVELSAGLSVLMRTDGPLLHAARMHAHAAAAACGAGLAHERRRADALTQAGLVRLLGGDQDGAQGALEQAGLVYRQLGDPLGYADTVTLLGVRHALAGNYRHALEHFYRALELYPDKPASCDRGNVLGWVGAVRRLCGDQAGAIRALHGAVDVFEELGFCRDRAAAHRQLQAAQQQDGDHAAAVRSHGAAVAACRRFGGRCGAIGALSWLDASRRLRAGLPGAYWDLEESLAQARTTRVYRQAPSIVLSYFAGDFAGYGHLERAIALYREALASASTAQRSCDELLAREGIAECLIKQGRPGDGATHLRRALRICDLRGNRIGADRIRTRLSALPAA